jgi:hypothetical protein
MWWRLGPSEQAGAFVRRRRGVPHRYGLLSEDTGPKPGAPRGTFLCSMAGLILTAMRLVARLGGLYWRG